MSTGSSGCVLNKVNNLFTCEKKCNSVASRKALLEDFTSKRYNADVVYVDIEGKQTKEQFKISFILSEKQKDSEMNRIHGFAILQKEEDTPIRLSWVGTYLAKKGGYKMRVVRENIEKDFYVYCDGNDKINFLIKKTVPEDLTVSGSKGGISQGAGVMLGGCNCIYQCMAESGTGGDLEIYTSCLDDCC